MNLLDKLSVTLARIGCAGLRNASEEHKDNLAYVKAVVKSQGARSFQFASDYIKSDVESLLEMVDVNPEILNHTAEIIYDRYVKDMEIVEEEVDYNLFALKCLQISVDALVYFEDEIRDRVINILKNENKYEGNLLGKPCSIDIKKLRANNDLMFIIGYLEDLKC